MTCHSKNCVLPQSGEIWRKPTLKDICTSPAREFATLAEMVAHYESTRKAPTERWLTSLTAMQPEGLWLTNFICGEANVSPNPADRKFCKNSHQNRMPAATVVEARATLKKCELASLSGFREILAEVVRATKDVKQFGTLAAFDFTLRYAYSRGIEPDTVYLHAGTMQGFKALQQLYPHLRSTVSKAVGTTVDAASLPEPVARLGNLHIENFLCIYDAQLAILAKTFNQIIITQ